VRHERTGNDLATTSLQPARYDRSLRVSYDLATNSPPRHEFATFPVTTVLPWLRHDPVTTTLVQHEFDAWNRLDSSHVTRGHDLV